MLTLRYLHRSLSALPSTSTASQPWFVDPGPIPIPAFSRRQPPPHLPSVQPLPENAPQHLRTLHSFLSKSPHLEPTTLVVCQPTSFPPGPPLPHSLPKGRRRRGRSYAGEGIDEPVSGIWSWFVMAQVKDGTENRGAIESVVRLVRKTVQCLTSIESIRDSSDAYLQQLLDMQLSIPSNSKRRAHNGWAMIDAGDFAVHILSRAAREKHFVKRDW